MHRGLSQHRTLYQFRTDGAFAGPPPLRYQYVNNGGPGSTHRPGYCQSFLHQVYVSTVYRAHLHRTAATQHFKETPGRAASTKHDCCVERWMGCGLHCCSHATKESSHCPVRRPEIRGAAHRHICPVDGPVNLSTQNTLCVVLCTMKIGRCLCTHVPCRFQGGMAIQRDALSTSTPPSTGTHVTGQSKYHTDSTLQH